MEKLSSKKVMLLASFLVAGVACLVFSFFLYKEYRQETAVVEQSSPITHYKIIDTEKVVGRKYNHYYATVLYNGREYNNVKITPSMYQTRDFRELRLYYDKVNDSMFSELQTSIATPILVFSLSFLCFFLSYKVLKGEE